MSINAIGTDDILVILAAAVALDDDVEAGYEFLRRASLVCKRWTAIAQKLMWSHVFIVEPDEFDTEALMAGELRPTSEEDRIRGRTRAMRLEKSAVFGRYRIDHLEVRSGDCVRLQEVMDWTTRFPSTTAGVRRLTIASLEPEGIQVAYGPILHQPLFKDLEEFDTDGLGCEWVWRGPEIPRPPPSWTPLLRYLRVTNELSEDTWRCVTARCGPDLEIVFDGPFTFTGLMRATGDRHFAVDALPLQQISTMLIRNLECGCDIDREITLEIYPQLLPKCPNLRRLKTVMPTCRAEGSREALLETYGVVYRSLKQTSVSDLVMSLPVEELEEGALDNWIEITLDGLLDHVPETLNRVELSFIADEGVTVATSLSRLEHLCTMTYEQWSGTFSDRGIALLLSTDVRTLNAVVVPR